MKFKTGFLLGVAAGAWVASKVSELQRGTSGARKIWGDPAGASTDDAVEKLRAFSDLARERLSGVMEGPIGHAARERLADLIGSSLGGTTRSPGDRLNGSIETTARWPR